MVLFRQLNILINLPFYSFQTEKSDNGKFVPLCYIFFCQKDYVYKLRIMRLGLVALMLPNTNSAGAQSEGCYAMSDFDLSISSILSALANFLQMILCKKNKYLQRSQISQQLFTN